MRQRIEYNSDDDIHLAKYIAVHSTSKRGRLGTGLYKQLVEDPARNWSVRHTWSSWRERYKNNQTDFDEWITTWQKKQKKKIASHPNNTSTGQMQESGQGKAEGSSHNGLMTEENLKRKRQSVDAGKEKASSDGKTAPKRLKISDLNNNEPESTNVRIAVPESIPEGLSTLEGKAPRGLIADADMTSEAQEQGIVQGNEPHQNGRKSNITNSHTSNAQQEPAMIEAHEEAEETDTIRDGATGYSPQVAQSSELAAALIYSDIDIPPSSSLPDSSQQLAEPFMPGALNTSTPRPLHVPGRQPGNLVPILQSEDPGTTASQGSVVQPPPVLPERTGTSVVQDESDSPTPWNTPKRRRRRIRESPFFASTSQRQPSPGPAKASREPPRLVEGPYRATFTDARGKIRFSPKWKRASGVDESDQSEDDEEEREVRDITKADATTGGATWPPPRTGHDEQSKELKAAFKIATSSRPQIFPPAKQKASSYQSSASAQTSQHHPFSQRTQALVPAVAPARVKEELNFSIDLLHLPPDSAHHPFSQSTLEENALPGSNITSKPAGRTSIRALAAKSRGRFGPQASVIQPMFSQALLDKRSKPRLPRHPDDSGADLPSGANKSRQVEGRASQSGSRLSPSDHPGPSSDLMSRFSVQPPPYTGQPVYRLPQPRAASFSSSTDPFVTDSLPHRRPASAESRISRPLEAFDRRQTFGGFPSDAPLMDSLAERFRRLHPESYSRRSSSNPNSDVGSISSVSSSLSAAEHALVTNLGVELVIQRMSDNHGFNTDVVTRVLKEAGSLEKTDEVLHVMRQEAEAAALKVLNTDDATRNLPATKLPDLTSVLSSRGLPRLNGILQMQPVLAEDINKAGYTPPETSRAGQYARLVNQGRIREARERERHRASNGGTSPRKAGTDGSAPASPLKRRYVHDDDDDIFNSQQDGASALLAPKQPVWGEEQDAILLSGDLKALRGLEKTFGKAFFRLRAIQLRASR